MESFKGHWLIVARFSNHPKVKTSIKLYQIYHSKLIIVGPERRLRLTHFRSEWPARGNGAKILGE